MEKHCCIHGKPLVQYKESKNGTNPQHSTNGTDPLSTNGDLPPHGAPPVGAMSGGTNGHGVLHGIMKNGGGTNGAALLGGGKNGEVQATSGANGSSRTEYSVHQDQSSSESGFER